LDWRELGAAAPHEGFCSVQVLHPAPNDHVVCAARLRLALRPKCARPRHHDPRLCQGVPLPAPSVSPGELLNAWRSWQNHPHSDLMHERTLRQALLNPQVDYASPRSPELSANASESIVGSRGSGLPVSFVGRCARRRSTHAGASGQVRIHSSLSCRLQQHCALLIAHCEGLATRRIYARGYWLRRRAFASAPRG
jgi:hypothetical protein